MRRFLLLISVMLLSVAIWADETIDYTTYAIRYSISNGNATVREVTIAEGADGSVTVPATITVSNETYPVVDNNTLPEASENTFDEDAYKDALLKTTDTEVANKEPWKNFANVEGSSSEQCAAPTIEYGGGKLKFTCETPGATIISKITIDDTSENSTNEVDLSKNYIVTAYAKKDGLRRSVTVTKTFQFTNGDVNLDGKIDIADIMMLVNRITGKVDALAPQLEVEVEP